MGRRVLLVVSVTALALVAAIAAALVLRGIETAEALDELEREANERAARLERELDMHAEALYGLVAVLQANAGIDAAGFRRLAAQTLARRSEMQAVAWASSGGAGRLTLVAVEPPAAADRMGDLGAEPALAGAARSARESGAAAVAPSAAACSRGGGFAMLVPFRGDASEDRFVVAAFCADAVFRGSGFAADEALIEMTLLDTTGGSKVRLYRHEGTVGSRLFRDIEYRRSVLVAGSRAWVLAARPSEAFMRRHRSGIVPAVLAAGFLLAGLIAGTMTQWLRRSLVVERLVQTRTRELDEANQRLLALTMVDGLTGAANRRHLDAMLDREWRRAARDQGWLTLVMADVDHFKRYNDRYGHLAGDECLKRVAAALRAAVNRPADLVARYGGEEFALLLPETDATAALIAERCRELVAALAIPHEDSPVAPCITLSCGYASMRPQVGEDPSRLIAAADQALYEAKRAGRNRVRGGQAEVRSA